MPAAVRGDVGELRRCLSTGQHLADQYRMAEPQAVQLCWQAMLAHVEGRFADASAARRLGAGQWVADTP